MSKEQKKEYKGYMRDAMQAADNKPEPQRSEALREIREKVLKDLYNDFAHLLRLHDLLSYQPDLFGL